MMKFFTIFLIFTQLSLAAESNNVTVHELHNQLVQNSSKLIVIDVRTPNEVRTTGIIKGALIKNAYDSDIQEYISKLDMSKSYVIYCHSGVRSQRFVDVMKTKKMKVLNLVGGISAWMKKGLPLVKK